jgi:hypothetical protein
MIAVIQNLCDQAFASLKPKDQKTLESSVLTLRQLKRDYDADPSRQNVINLSEYAADAFGLSALEERASKIAVLISLYADLGRIIRACHSEKNPGQDRWKPAETVFAEIISDVQRRNYPELSCEKAREAIHPTIQPFDF